MTPEYEHLKRCVGGLQRALPRVQDQTLTIPQSEAWASVKRIAWAAFYRAQDRGTPEALLGQYRKVLLQADGAPYRISSIGKPGRPRKS